VLIEDLFSDIRANVAAAIDERREILSSLDLRPVYFAVSTNDANALLARESEVHIADSTQELLINRTFPRFGAARITPNRCKLLPRHRNAVQNKMIE
jgi:hypothetical protein